jgi:hypothetical protein
MRRTNLRSLPRRLLLAAALLVAGVALGLGAMLLGDDGLRIAHADHPVNQGAGNLADISAHNSPTLARNPRDRRNLAVTSRIDSPDFSCALHVSADDGAHWWRVKVPIPPGPARKCYAPDAGFASDGTLHVVYVTLQGRGNTPAAVWLASSRDGGRTLSAPRRVAGPLAFQVRLAADPRRPGTLYVSWVQAREVGTLRFTSANPIVVARSDDGGRNWERPVRASSPARSRVLAPSPAVGPRGELYVLYLDVRGDTLDYEGGHDALGGPPYAGRFTLVVARSLDRGATWTESVVDDRVRPTRRFVAFLPPFPALAVDGRSGKLYVAFEDARDGDPDVSLWSLVSGASRWAGPVRVNDTAVGDRTDQYLPKLAVAPDGRVDVAYYDRRDDAGSNVFNDVSLQSSRDGGRTFGAHAVLSSTPFDSRIGLGTERGLADLGSRLGLVSGDDGAAAVWSDTRSGTEASLKQDLYMASVRAEQRRWWVSALRYAGIALVLGGLLALGDEALARRRRTPRGA